MLSTQWSGPKPQKFRDDPLIKIFFLKYRIASNIFIVPKNGKGTIILPIASIATQQTEETIKAQGHSLH